MAAAGRTRRVFAVLGTAVFLVLAPGTFDVYVSWAISRWRVHAPFPGFTALRIVGGLLIAAAIPILLESFARFALQGVGTPAPVFPTQRLVVKGFYRYVRNPMYVGVLSIILGQALLFAHAGLLWLSAIMLIAFHVFVIGYEEPTLSRTFGDDYARFRANVPRWLPRLRPWRP